MTYLLMFLTHAEPAVVSFWSDFDTDVHATRTSSTYPLVMTNIAIENGDL